MKNSDNEVEDFYGVYLLYNINPAFKGRIYIGYTVNPNRRIRQHNTGRQAGGAKKTSGKGPWEMVLTIHGFPNNISALRFEWAWQHPLSSRRLKHLPKKKRTETGYMYRFRILCEMLCIGPWNRLPLTIRWLKQEYQMEFTSILLPPIHMAIAYGPVRSKKIKPPPPPPTQSDNWQDAKSSLSCSNDILRPTLEFCCVCNEEIEDVSVQLKCINCTATSHIVCLANHFRSQSSLEEPNEFLIPVEGKCPICTKEVLWGDLIRLKKGCYQNLIEYESNDSDDDWTTALSQQR